MAKSKPKKAAAQPAKAKVAKPKPKAKAVKAKAKPKTVKAAKPKKAAPKAKASKPKAAKAAPKSKTVKKAAKPKAKPKTAAVTGEPMLVIKPVITAPANGSSHNPANNLVITATTNDTAVRYRIVVTDITGSPPYPTPTDIDLPAPGASPFNGTIPRATFDANKTYEIKLIVHPSDGSTPPNEASVIIIYT